MSIILAGNGSTQSRGRRPQPSWSFDARSLTEHSIGVRELVEFSRSECVDTRQLITWVVGQFGGLWAHGPYPPEIMREFGRWEIPGSYAHSAEHRLMAALDEVYDHRLTSDALAVRFFGAAGAACEAAVRISRAVTGRDPFASYGYHGAHSTFIQPPQSAGVPKVVQALKREFEFGDVAALDIAARGAACVIVEVPPTPDDQAQAFLQVCRRACDREAIPFIIDDTVLGFRLALAGSSAYYGVKPDMVILGKAMSAIGGVAALLGRADLVNRLADDVFYSETFGGHPMLCSIAAATVRHLTYYGHGVYGPTGHLHTIGKALQDGFNELGVTCIGQPERSVVKFPTDAEWLTWCSQMIARGVMVHRPQFVTLSHSMSDVERTLEAAEKVARDG